MLSTSTVLGLFKGENKYVYIALLICGLGFAGMTWLSVELYADKAVLSNSLSDAKGEITDLKKERNQLQMDKDNLQEVITKMAALSEQAQADAKRNAELGAKKLQEIERSYANRLKRFEEKAKGVKDYGKSDSSIVDSAGI